MSIVAAAFAGGCRWVSLREKDLPEDEQIAIRAHACPACPPPWRTRDAARRCPALAPAPAAPMACTCQRAATPAAARKAKLGAGKLIGASIHTVTEADALDPRCSIMRLRVPLSRHQASPVTGRRSDVSGLAEIARARSCADPRHRRIKRCTCLPR